MSPGPQTPPAHPARGPGLPAGCKGLAFLHRGLCHTPGTVRALAHSMFTPTLCCGDHHCPHFRARVTEAERSGTCSKSHWSTTEPRFKPGTAADSLSRHALPGTAAPRPAHRPPPRSWSPTAWRGLDPHAGSPVSAWGGSDPSARSGAPRAQRSFGPPAREGSTARGRQGAVSGRRLASPASLAVIVSRPQA